MQRWIMHLDMDAFFAAIEQRDRPELQGRPVVVGALPGHRGVVATCSYEARRFGLRSAMPISEACYRCPDAVYLRPDMGRYAHESRRLMSLLHRVSPLVEPVSVDEAFLDVSGLERLVGPPDEIGRRVKRAIRDEMGLSASVGIGPNRLIAKLASDHHKPDGLTLVPPRRLREFLDPLPIRSLRGVGARTGSRLDRLGIRNVADLRTCPPMILGHHLGQRVARELLLQSHGVGDDRVGCVEGRKSISKETTFEVDESRDRRLRHTLLQLAGEVGRRARAEALAGRRLTLKIRFSGFETHTRQCVMYAPINGDRDIYRGAVTLYREVRLAGRAVRLIGIGLSEWGAGHKGQLDLFGGAAADARDEALWRTLDQVSARFGHGKLQLGMPPGRGK